MKTYKLSGHNIKSLGDFFREFAEMVGVEYFGHNIQSFDDCLFGGYGLQSPCEIHWHDSELSAKYLDHQCLAAWCQEVLKRNDFPDEDSRREVEKILDEASARERTIQELLIENMRSAFQRSGGTIDINVVLK
ncbi:MAG TPA: barstar family protein [Oligoflexus sp.]|uniref:barstar family protein n=1 Tax=Oligoflexus sp. TaxID=1971216 RepID=UPI002D804DE7|nr:barstar family protein [Oligoflexus sp.]HET9239217.1 barstar family protein [Oligoflexus sp.]